MNTKKQHHLTSEELKKLQNVELELLIEFDRICRKHEITYSIDGGTLLGAVRHGGFIPWDDDADVILTRNEYERFLLVVDQELNTDKFYLQDINRTSGYRWGYAKLRRSNTDFIRLNQEHMPYEQGIFLDIFVGDNVPDNYISRCICNVQSYIYRKIFYSEVGKFSASGISKHVYIMLNSIPENTVKNSYNRYVKFRNRKSTEMVRCLTFPACNREYGYHRKWYEDTIDMEFEGVTLRACRDYEGYLRFLYGDYLTLPALEDRKVHPVSKLTFPTDY